MGDPNKVGVSPNAPRQQRPVQRPRDIGTGGGVQGIPATNFSNNGGPRVPTPNPSPNPFAFQQNLAGQNFLDNVAFGQQTGQGNPIFGQALDTIFNSNGASNSLSSAQAAANSLPSINFGAIQPNFNLGSNIGVDPVSLISQGQSQQAIDRLLNGGSVFDAFDPSNPLSQRLDDITNRSLDAVSQRLGEERDDALQFASARSAATSPSLLSSSQNLNRQDEIIRNSLNDFTLQALGFERQNIDTLGNLAFQDLQLGSNNAVQVLSGALQQAGMNQETASRLAITEIQKLQALEQERIRAAANLQGANISANASLLGQGLQNQSQNNAAQINAASNLLGLGQSGFQNTINNATNASLLPVTIPQSVLSGLPGTGSQSSSSKNI